MATVRRIEPLWDGNDGARRLSLPGPESFWSWCRSNDVPIIRFSRKVLRVRPDDVEAVIQRRAADAVDGGAR